ATRRCPTAAPARAAARSPSGPGRLLPLREERPRQQPPGARAAPPRLVGATPRPPGRPRRTAPAPVRAPAPQAPGLGAGLAREALPAARNFGDNNPPVAYTSSAHTLLAHGQTYWLLPFASGDTVAAWNLNDQGQTGTRAESHEAEPTSWAL